MTRLFRFTAFKRRRRGRYPDIVGFGRDACEVIGARTSKGMSGNLTVAEAHRMVSEKQIAAVNAYFAFFEAITGGKAHGAPAASFDVYRKAVAANHRRLVRRKLWPF